MRILERLMIKRYAAILVGCTLGLLFNAQLSGAEPQDQEVRLIRFVDNATGYEVHPSLHVTADQSGQAYQLEAPDNAGIQWRGQPGRYRFEVQSADYRPLTGAFTVSSASPLPIWIMLEPVTKPKELTLDYLSKARRADSMVFLGFVVNDDQGTPIAGVQITSLPSGITAQSDARGFFELSVPLAPGEMMSYHSLIFEAAGYNILERRHLECWPGGDWELRLRLHKGHDREVVDEWDLRRGPISVEPSSESASKPADASPPSETTGKVAGAIRLSPSSAVVPPAIEIHPSVRLPTSVRVWYNNAVYFEALDEYCRHVLPKEWYASWAAFAGGSNSLQAGAVAVRTYALGYVNRPAGDAYDLGSTTAYQVYDPTVTSTRTDAAISATTHCVMIGPTLPVPAGLTEYSAENNSLMLTGDGYTGTGIFDPVCRGEARNGHGRGLCQWGSARWATGLKFPGNSLSDTVRLNGQSRQDWIWILQHYYPSLRLVRGTALSVGDDVRVAATALKVRATGSGGIDQGLNSPAIGTMTNDAAGVIIAGPELVMSDGRGYHWWKIRWDNNQIEGWSAENWLERLPPAPSAANANAVTPTRVLMSWEYPAGGADGFTITAAWSPEGPWRTVANPGSNDVSCVLSNLVPATTYYFRLVAISLAEKSHESGSVAARTFDPWLRVSLAPPASAVVSWSSVAGQRYQVQYKSQLDEPVWTNLSLDVKSSGETAYFPDAIMVRQRFYRILKISE
jgi:hypothetical protein